MNSVSAFSKLSLTLLMSVFLIQCGNDNDPDNGSTNLIGKADTGVCAHSPNDGETVDTANKSLTYEDSGYFSKTLMIGHLESLLFASGDNSSLYIMGQGINLYQVTERPDSQCKYFAGLSIMSSEAKEQWDKNSKSNLNPQGQTNLLGLFYYYPSTAGNPQIENQVGSPTIIVRQDTQKWTLLHEFSHFLFAKGRARHKKESRSYLRELLEESGDDTKKAKRQYDNNPTRPRARQLVSHWERFFELSYNLDARGPLEEYAIESMMAEYYANQSLAYINPRTDIKNARGYMNSNSRPVVRRYNRLTKTLRAYRDDFRLQGWNRLDQRVTSLLGEVEEVLYFIDNKNIRIDEIYQSVSSPVVGLGLEVMTLHTLYDDAHSDIAHHHFDEEELLLQDELYDSLF